MLSEDDDTEDDEGGADSTEPGMMVITEDSYNDNDANAMPQVATQTYRNPIIARAPLQYRDDGTLIVPEIHSFVPPTPTVTPQELFPLQQLRRDRQFLRFVHYSNQRHLLIYTDGACLNNGQLNPAAGWGFVFRAPKANCPQLGRISGRLEDLGPSGESHPQTSNRAELRAVIAVLKFRAWYGEGFTKLVIATDSEYVTKGATVWVRTWGQNGWMTSNRNPVKNRDLWEELLGQIIRHQRNGMDICFWRIPRAWNEVADSVAKAGASREPIQHFRTTMGVLV